MKNKQKKASIKKRILKSILLLIISIFIGITVLFNILIARYINNITHENLENSKKNITSNNISNFLENGDNANKEEGINSFFSHIQHGEKKRERKFISSDTRIFIINEDYSILYPAEGGEESQDYNIDESIINKIKEKELNLNSKENIKLAVDGEYYYISFAEIQYLEGDEPCYAVVCIDLTNTIIFMRRINLVLITVMCIAAVLAIIISIILSNKIVNPIKVISKFAMNIGNNDFTKCQYNFEDKELDELCQVMNKSAGYLEKYDKEQKVFFQNVSHELRTPLMSIKGYAEAIKYGVYDKDMASEIILQESDRLSDLIEELLYLSRTDNITKDYIYTERDLREILSNCVARQKAAVLNKKIEFIFKFDDKPVMLICEEKSIYRAFLNIVDNALRYAENKIIITCMNNKEGIIATIENDGEKIADGDMPYIFERFYKGKNGKHGIGLAIVKTIIEKHKGSISAENTEMGVAFKVIFKNNK